MKQRATVYIEKKELRKIKHKAIELDISFSSYVNELIVNDNKIR